MQKRLADEANRMGHQAQEQLQSGFEAAARSFAETHKGFQSLALEMIEYSKAAFDDATRTWEQLIGVKSVEQAMQIQSAYAKRVYGNHWQNCLNSVGCAAAWWMTLSETLQEGSNSGSCLLSRRVRLSSSILAAASVAERGLKTYAAFA